MMRPADVTISDLAPLLYRARWLRSSLAGDVRSRRKRGGDHGHDELNGSLLAAPGGRYRADLTDEDGDRELRISDGQAGSVPFPELLIPSWLLADFDLRITGQTEHIGRTAYAVAGQPRQAAGEAASRVSALVDAELGVLLRYEKTGPRGKAETAEFTSLTVDAAESADPQLFTRPPAAQQEHQNQPQPSDSPAATRPAPQAGTTPDLSDDQVNLLYRSTLGSQKFSAELNEQADVETMTRLAQAAVSATELGRRTRGLWQSPEDTPPEIINRTAQIHVAIPGCYRIDTLTDPETKPVTTACDGNRLWLVYPDRIAVRPAAPPPAGISLIIDPAWLLHEHPLTADETVTDTGRPALRLVATLTQKSARGPLSGTMIVADKVEATIDLQLGIALTQIWYRESNPVLHTELANVTPDADPATFRIEPPPGTRVITGGLLAEAGLSPAGAAWTAAKVTAKLGTEIGKRWARRPRS
jgi:outer membrane lipoprotein-sorting protein